MMWCIILKCFCWVSLQHIEWHVCMLWNLFCWKRKLLLLVHWFMRWLLLSAKEPFPENNTNICIMPLGRLSSYKITINNPNQSILAISSSIIFTYALMKNMLQSMLSVLFDLSIFCNFVHIICWQLPFGSTMDKIYILHRFFEFILLHWVHVIDTMRITAKSNIQSWLALHVAAETIHTLSLGKEKIQVLIIKKTGKCVPDHQ